MDLDSEPSPIGSTIHLYLTDGRPSGIRVVEKDNWSGVGVDLSRADLASAKSRREFQRCGIYLLVGEEVPSGLPTIYIGEADELGGRIAAHASGKDFWTRLVLFTDKDGNINKAHAKHLEARLCAIGWSMKRCELKNIAPPRLPNLSDSDKDFAERFLQEMLIVLPVIGITSFQIGGAPRAPSPPLLTLDGPPAAAKGYETSEGFRVLEGSIAKATEVPSIHGRTRDLRASLIENGVLAEDHAGLMFTQDYVFDSPSEAAAVLLGRSVNGREQWVSATGRTLKELQEDATEAF
jgi:hypothetical protein